MCVNKKMTNKYAMHGRSGNAVIAQKCRIE